MSNYAPILLFTYNRLDSLKQTAFALQKNALAAESDLFIFSDGAKNEHDQEFVNQVRHFIRTITGFKSVTIKEAPENKGLANSIIAGVTEMITLYDKVIVLEDDLITSLNFLSYMNQGLENYKGNLKVFSISGYTFPIQIPANYSQDNYFTRRASSWGWATWKDRWENIDWNVTDYDIFSKDSKLISEFNQMGSDMTHMLSKHMKGKIDSWAIRWCYHQYKFNLLSVFPIISKVSNIGFGDAATHTNEKYNRFASTRLDSSEKLTFQFNPKVELDQRFIKQFIAKYSLKTRIFYKIKNLIG